MPMYTHRSNDGDVGAVPQQPPVVQLVVRLRTHIRHVWDTYGTHEDTYGTQQPPVVQLVVFLRTHIRHVWDIWGHIWDI